MINFDLNLFTTLMKKRKIIKESPILLERKGGKYLEKKVPAHISQESLEIEFIANKQRYILTKYLIQLRCVKLCKEPYFRLDSDGPSHRNKKKGTKIVLESITTPHFNTFDENGKWIAFKTQLLKNKKSCEILKNDISIGVNHFCKEANVRFNKIDFPIIEYRIPELALNDKTVDPNSTVTFKI